MALNSSIESLRALDIKAVFTDLDDTLTENGQISADTYRSLAELKRAGFRVVIVSGRPAGWADALTRLWPLDAMIFENGAGFLYRNGDRLETQILADPSPEGRLALERSLTKLRLEIPEIRLAEDQPYRRFDVAIDVSEQSPHLSEENVQKALKILSEEKEITAKLSSIHINFWAGQYTKVLASEKVLSLLGVTAEQAVFVGDSPNDEPLFANFPHSVGVQNVFGYLDQINHPPRYLTKSPSGAGFQELCRVLLKR